MHQTFYIDIDEEITSVIDRMRKARLKKLVFVIPQRALVLQSTVNLKLLKRQAERMKKQIMIVSQDEQTRAVAEKIGISFQTSMQGISEDSEYKAQSQPDGKNRTDIVAKGNVINLTKKEDRDIGSSGYYDSGFGEKREEERIPDHRENIMPSAAQPMPAPEKNLTFQSMAAKSPVSRPAVSQNMITPQQQMENRKKAEVAYPRQEAGTSCSWKPIENLPKEKEKFITSIYKPSPPVQPSPLAKEKPVHIPVGKGIKKTMIIFGIISIFIAGGVIAYLFLPQAKVAITIKDQELGFSFETTAKTSLESINLAERMIPAEYISKDIKNAASFKATGSADGKDRKAYGKVMIYNEFSAEPQSLVATTRLMTSDGKLFRLTKGVTVPGMAKVGSENKPGVVEAEVAADQPGEEYNIGPSEFKIPGFEGGPKYEKFYAKSQAAMAGGGTSENAVRMISKNDLTAAKAKTEQELRDQKEEALAEGLSENMLLVENSVELDAVQVSCPPEGQIGENFECTANTKAKAFAVNAKDLEQLALRDINQSGEAATEFSQGGASYHFVGAKADHASQSVTLKVEGKGKAENSLDEAKIKNELAGKGNDDLKDILKKFPQIKEIEVQFWPNLYLKKLPSDPNKFILEIKK